MRYMHHPAMDLWTSCIHEALFVTSAEDANNSTRQVRIPVALYLGDEEFKDFVRAFGWDNEVGFFGHPVKIHRVMEKNHFHLRCK